MERYFPLLSFYKDIIRIHLDEYVSGCTKRIMQSDFYDQDIPGLLLVSKSSFLLKEVAKRHCRAINTTTSTQGKKRVIESELVYHHNKHIIIYEHYHDHIEIDLASFNSTSNDRSVICGFLKELLLRQNILGTKHIIIIHGIDLLNTGTILSLRHIIEDSYEYAYFVLTCSTVSPSIQTSIIPRCFFVNISRDFDIEGMTEKLLINKNKNKNKNKPKEEEEEEHCTNCPASSLVKMSKNDIMNVCILLHLSRRLLNNSSTTFVGHLEPMIHDMMTSCRAHICNARRIEDRGLESNREILQLGDEIRQACTKIGAACASLVHVAECVIKYTALSRPDMIYDIVTLSARMQHIAILSNKELFILEQYFYQVLMKIENYRDNVGKFDMTTSEEKSA